MKTPATVNASDAAAANITPQPWLRDRLRLLRPQGKSHAGLAAALDIHASGVSNIIGGGRAIAAAEIGPLAAYLDMAEANVLAAINRGSSRREPSRKVANDLDASAAIDMERADTLRREADALVEQAARKRAQASMLRGQFEAE